MQTQQPWMLLKESEDQKKQSATIIGLCANIACLLANFLLPYIAATARPLFIQLNAKQTPLNAGKPLATLLLPAGHRIGKPAALFTKLEQSFIDELKTKCGGIQTATVHSQCSAAELEKVVQDQADKVRQLKASIKDKTVWQPEVNMLLDLKNQLEEAKHVAPVATPLL
ncbi:hypothetical protein KR038_004581 [Drosophila bunnanda]|nr:hypothetical protein KR038_004581 [Drosophila bunnanda]